MKITKIFKVFRKGSKAAAKVKGKKGEAGREAWPPGLKIGIFGQANSGKTVYLTVLNEECKISKNLQISVTDNVTASELLSNYRAIWGLGTAVDAGTVVDLKGEKKFPDSTTGDKVLQFTAILDQGRKLQIVSYDYNGEALSISKPTDLTEKVFDFMSRCDGLLIFYDPKVLGAELQTQAHVASFVGMLERLAPLHSRMPIPVALVISKADILPGFSGEAQTVLVNPEDEHFYSEDFDQFVERVLSSNRISTNSQWAGTVRNVLVKLREFLRVIVGRTLNFQIFFISNTGNTPEKVGADVGRSIYAPPPKIHPIGVKEPFYWLLKSIVRNRRISRFRKLAKYVAVLSIIWILLFSLPFVYHFKFLLPKPQDVEENVLKAYGGQAFGTNRTDRAAIIDAYSRYERRWMVRKFFSNFRIPAKKIREAYQNFDMGKAARRLDNVIIDFARMVKDSTAWPRYNPSKDSMMLSEAHQKFIDELHELRGENQETVLYIRGDRTITYWDLFTKYIANRNDTLISNSIIEQVQFDKAGGKDLSPAERQLGDALASIAERKKIVVEKKADSRAALEEFESLKARIDNSTDPAFLFGSAVRELNKIKGKLDPGQDTEQIAMIERYLADVRKWEKRQTFTYKLEAVPDMGHLHIDVTADGVDPRWPDSTQLFEGDELKLKWKIDDDIYIAFDTLKSDEYWGRVSSDKKPLKGKYSLFEMEGDVTFSNIGKTLNISFKPSLREQLPKLK
jgi:hypothetical protein